MKFKVNSFNWYGTRCEFPLPEMETSKVLNKCALIAPNDININVAATHPYPPKKALSKSITVD